MLKTLRKLASNLQEGNATETQAAHTIALLQEIRDLLNEQKAERLATMNRQHDAQLLKEGL